MIRKISRKCKSSRSSTRCRLFENEDKHLFKYWIFPPNWAANRYEGLPTCTPLLSAQVSHESAHDPKVLRKAVFTAMPNQLNQVQAKRFSPLHTNCSTAMHAIKRTVWVVQAEIHVPPAGLVDLVCLDFEAAAVCKPARAFAPTLILEDCCLAMSPAALWNAESLSSSMQGSTLHDVITIHININAYMYSYVYIET